MYNPGTDHWENVKWILRYVKGLIDKGSVFHRNKTATLDVADFVDSDYVADLDRRRSISRCVFTMCIGVISCKTLFQSIATLSSTGAEYVVVTKGVKEAT